MICIYLQHIPLFRTLHLIYKICSVFCILIFICSVMVNFVSTPQLFSICPVIEWTCMLVDSFLWEKDWKTKLWHSCLKLKLCFSPAGGGSWWACWPKETPATNICVHDAPTQVFFILDWGNGHVVLHLWAWRHVIWRTERVSLLLSSNLI